MENDRNTQGEEKIGRLIAAAGPGPTASAAARERVYAAAHASWQQTLRQREQDAGRESTTAARNSATAAAEAGGRKLLPRYRMFGLAATVAAAALVLYWLDSGGPGGIARAELAVVARIEGGASLDRDAETIRLAAGAAAGPILTGDVLRTDGDGRLALRLGDGLELRVNVDTELAFVGADALDLVQGTVYVDSGAGSAGPALEIRTALGAVTHLGTQYEVHFVDSGLRLRVREGSVRFSGTSGSAVGAAGEELEIDADGASVRGTIAADDAAWSWAVALATLPEAAEYRLDATLAWIAREQGLRLDYAAADMAPRLARETIVGIGGLDPAETLDVLARTTDLTLRIDDDRLLVGD